MSDIEVLPIIIDEVIYPPEVPESVRPLIESAINCYNQSNFYLALDHLEKAKVIYNNIKFFLKA